MIRRLPRHNHQNSDTSTPVPHCMATSADADDISNHGNVPCGAEGIFVMPDGTTLCQRHWANRAMHTVNTILTTITR